MVVDTACGVVWRKLGFKDKEEVLSAPFFQELLLNLQDYTPYFSLGPKLDELLPSDGPAQVTGDKLRLIAIAPTEHVYLTRMFFDPQNKAIKGASPSAYGACFFEGGFARMVSSLQAIGGWFCEWDVSGFDTRFPLMREVAGLRRQFLGTCRPPLSPLQLAQADWCLEHCITSHVVFPDGTVIVLDYGNRSGTSNTTVDNIVGHSIALSMLLGALTGDYGLTGPDRLFFIYGDDILGALRTDHTQEAIISTAKHIFSLFGWELSPVFVESVLAGRSFLGARATQISYGNTLCWVPLYDDEKILTSAVAGPVLPDDAYACKLVSLMLLSAPSELAFRWVERLFDAHIQECFVSGNPTLVSLYRQRDQFTRESFLRFITGFEATGDPFWGEDLKNLIYMNVQKTRTNQTARHQALAKGHSVLAALQAANPPKPQGVRGPGAQGDSNVVKRQHPSPPGGTSRQLPRLAPGQHPQGGELAPRARGPHDTGSLSAPVRHHLTQNKMWVAREPTVFKVGEHAFVVHRGLTASMFKHNVGLAFKNPPSASPDKEISAPVSEGYQWHGAHVFEHDSIKHGEHSVTISGCTYVTDAHVDLSFVQPGLNRGATLLVNPQFFGGRLAALAQQFQYFKFTRLIVRYIPMVPTTSAGAWIMFYVANNSVTAAFSGSAELAIASTYNSFLSNPVWGRGDLEADMSESLPMYSCVPGDVEENTVQGIIGTGVSGIGVPGGSEPAFVGGQLFVQYVCEFFKPRISRQMNSFLETACYLTIGTGFTCTPGQAVVLSIEAPHSAASTVTCVSAPAYPIFGVLEVTSWNVVNATQEWFDGVSNTRYDVAPGVSYFVRSYLMSGTAYMVLYPSAAGAEQATFTPGTGGFSGALTHYNTATAAATYTAAACTLRYFETDTE